MRRRPAPRRQILQVATKKKSDTMPCYTNLFRNNPDPAEFSIGQVFIIADQNPQPVSRVFLWMPTARPALHSNQQFPAAINSTMRTSQETYWPGVKERVRWQTYSGMTWQWRRIVFFFKGSDIVGVDNNDPEDSPVFRQDPGVVGTRNGGMVRLVNEVPSDIAAPLKDIVFTGTEGADWIDAVTAGLDRKKIRVAYDVTRNLRSRNEYGTAGKLNLWHPIRGNVVYGGDESGDIWVPSPFSSEAPQSVGDMYIMDIFQQVGAGSTAEDSLQIEFNATAYWHER